MNKSRATADRRQFLRNMSLATLTSLLGTAIPFHRYLPQGFVPVALANSLIDGKDALTLLNDRPLNAETPPELLDDPTTPTARHFVRNNGQPPSAADPGAWVLEVDGLVERPLRLTIADLKSRFESQRKALVIECGGNGRAFFDPPARGNQWTYGAVGCSYWTGVRLRDLLNEAGVREGAIYTAHYGADKHLSGDPARQPISRGLPIRKALQENVLIAYEMNDEPLHPMNGAPLRLVVPGWPGSCSQKWLTRIRLRDIVHDGAKMTGKSYRVPNRPVAPGEKVDKADFEIIERMPVKSLITFPATGAELVERTAQVRGHAWSGDRSIVRVDISTDFGASWRRAELDQAVNDGAWQNWRIDLDFAQPGYYEIWSRATDSGGLSQPSAIAWNPKGYLNNTVHRIAVRVS